jgi:probable rRNA maturation factor
MIPAIAISIEDTRWRAVPLISKKTRRAIAACLEQTLFLLPKTSELSILLCDDAKIRELNKEWRKIDKATNVLSFPVGDPKLESLLGDIVISFETLDREARTEGKTFSDHYLHMIVHGFLHLLGFDHEVIEEAKVMEQCEREVLARIGIADPYRAVLKAETSKQ